MVAFLELALKGYNRGKYWHGKTLDVVDLRAVKMFASIGVLGDILKEVFIRMLVLSFSCLIKYIPSSSSRLMQKKP